MIKTLRVHGCLLLSSISCSFIFVIWLKMSKMKTLIESTDIPEFKNVLENWDDSHSPDEAANEIAKLLKGQQPKVFLTWLIELSDQQISPGECSIARGHFGRKVKQSHNFKPTSHSLLFCLCKSSSAGFQQGYGWFGRRYSQKYSNRVTTSNP